MGQTPPAPAPVPSSAAAAPVPSSSTSATADELKALCQSHQSTIIQKTQFNFEPNYFAKLFAVKNYSTVIASKHTYVVNLETGHLIQVEGTYDPVPTPDEVFLTTIYAGQDDTNGPRYFQASDIFNHPNSQFEHWIASDYTMSYAYQSLGVLEGAKTGPYTYRFLVDNDEGTVYFRDDYFAKPQGGGSGLANYLINSKPWVQACTNIRSTLKLPMISKDGRRVAFYNTGSHVTQVYDVNDKGLCSNAQNLPFVTGKADFSFDSNSVAFHMGRIIEPAKWFETADPSRRLDVFVWNLKDKTLTRLTDMEQGNAYFPTFKKNGEVGFLTQTPSGKSHKYMYVISDPSKGITLEQFPDLSDKCNCRLDGFTELAAIGVLKDTMCKIGSTNSLEAEAALPLTLTREQCSFLLNNYWEPNKTKILQKIPKYAATSSIRKNTVATRLKTMTVEELSRACPASEGATVIERPTVGTEVITSTTDPVERLEISCSKCHSGEAPKAGFALNLKNPLSMPLEARQKMVSQIMAGNMPPGGLNDSDRKMLEDYLVKK